MATLKKKYNFMRIEFKDERSSNRHSFFFLYLYLTSTVFQQIIEDSEL